MEFDTFCRSQISRLVDHVTVCVIASLLVVCALISCFAYFYNDDQLCMRVK